MNGLIVDIQYGDDAQEPENPLQDGFINHGSASAKTGTRTWIDNSKGASYGCGQRYDYEETSYITKVAPKNLDEEHD